VKVRFQERAQRLDPPEIRMPGAYKGGRKRQPEKVQAECPCGWKSAVLPAERAEQAYLEHLEGCHPDEDLRRL